MSNPVNWFEIYVQDMSRAKTFYETVLQVALTKLGNADLDMWGFPGSQTGSGASGSLVHMPGMPSGGNSTIVYFRCDDCAVEAKRAAASGGRVMKDKFGIGEYGFIALAFDTEGNLFGLHSMK
jgi:predicted enzyme related to lactoylglutathione lyase